MYNEYYQPIDVDCARVKCNKNRNRDYISCGYCNICFLHKKKIAFENKVCLKCHKSNNFQYFQCPNIGIRYNQYSPWLTKFLCRSCIPRNKTPPLNYDILRESDKLKCHITKVEKNLRVLNQLTIFSDAKKNNL